MFKVIDDFNTNEPTDISVSDIEANFTDTDTDVDPDTYELMRFMSSLPLINNISPIQQTPIITCNNNILLDLSVIRS